MVELVEGTLDHSALKELLQDIKGGLVEIFDKRQTSFVSITRQV